MSIRLKLTLSCREESCAFYRNSECAGVDVIAGTSAPVRFPVRRSNKQSVFQRKWGVKFMPMLKEIKGEPLVDYN